ncbi:DUF4133 domain-containing protein [Chitinophaga sp. Hz27]|uniref:DUF4133 domain-containing protein n=1 Tax=Chitinophaga silvatica TaxID=2282649 RepID=A0A3E1YHD2_9BACT|nr:DUF4133 domain-containing protein [Chitinophaga silvatica]RFS26792.1 DUF4133 domain-containing protein [Chitinophaga silvatica]
MANSVYSINKGINRPLEFKGLKAQYIWYMAVGVFGVLILFVILYSCRINTYVCLVIGLSAGASWAMWIYKLSHKYGEYGLTKKLARRSVPKSIRAARNRDLFVGNLNGVYGKSDERNVADNGGRA